MKTRRFIGVCLMAVGPALMLGAGWIVLSWAPFRGLVFNQYQVDLVGGGYENIRELKGPVLVLGFSAFLVAGLASIFGGLWLFRSARPLGAGLHREHPA